MNDTPPTAAILRPLSAEDAHDLHAVLSDPAVSRYTPLASAGTMSDTARYIAQCRSYAAIGSLHTFAVSPASAPARLLGIVSASRLTMDVELGCALARAYWGQRVMLGALDTLLKWVGQHAPGRRVWATCDAEHVAARQTLEALGLRAERALPRYRVHPALGYDPRYCLMYSR